MWSAQLKIFVLVSLFRSSRKETSIARNCWEEHAALEEHGQGRVRENLPVLLFDKTKFERVCGYWKFAEHVFKLMLPLHRLVPARIHTICKFLHGSTFLLMDGKCLWFYPLTEREIHHNYPFTPIVEPFVKYAWTQLTLTSVFILTNIGQSWNITTNTHSSQLKNERINEPSTSPHSTWFLDVSRCF